MKIAVIPDTHFPYCNEIKLNQAIGTINKFRPDAIIQIGDLLDQVSFSNYPKDPSRCVLLPKDEILNGIDQAKEMWHVLRASNKKAKCYQLRGNHDARLVKRLQQRLPEAAFVGQMFLDSLMQFDGVQNVSDEFILDDIMFMHGHRKMGEHAKWNQMNTVTGHTHKARIEYFMNRHGNYWEFNTGWLGDKDAYPFAYRSQKKIDDTQQGIGLIEHRQPRFVAI